MIQIHKKLQNAHKIGNVCHFAHDIALFYKYSIFTIRNQLYIVEGRMKNICFETDILQFTYKKARF